MVMNFISKWARNEHGATMVEYGIAILVAVVVGTSGLLFLGQQVNGNMTSAATEMDPDNN